MNKKLLTLAVAAAIAAPGLASAEAIMYGKIHQSIDYYDVKTNVFAGDGSGDVVTDDGFKGWTLNRGRAGQGAPRSNRIGVKGSEDLGNGLKAVYQIEFGVSLANENDYAIANGDRGTISMRNTFAGLAGGWGTLLVGRHDTPLKISTGKLDLFSDTMADYNGTVGFDDIRADNAIAYISPSWNGLQFAGAVVPGSGSTVGGDSNIDADSIAQAYSLALIYKNGPFFGSVAYEVLEAELGAGNVTTGTNGDLFALTPAAGTLNGNDVYATQGLVAVLDADGNPTGLYEEAPGTTTSLVTPENDYTKWRIGLGLLDWNGFTLTGIYETHDSSGFVKDNDPVFWQVQAGYAFGNMMFKGMYGQVDRDLDRSERRVVRRIENFVEDSDKSTWALGFDYNFSKRTTAYVLYTDVSDDLVGQNDWSGFSLGLIHSF